MSANCDGNTSANGVTDGRAGFLYEHILHALWNFHSRAPQASKQASERTSGSEREREQKTKNKNSRGRLNCICRSKNAFNSCFYSFNFVIPVTLLIGFNQDLCVPACVCVCCAFFFFLKINYTVFKWNKSH